MAAVPPPEIIRDDGPEGRWTVYYKPDRKFGQPKAFVIFQLLTRKAYSSAQAAALSNMYEFSLTDKLGEYAYDAGLAGLTYDVRIVPRGVRLTLGGYNDKLQTFAKYISTKISTDMRDVLPSDEAEFQRYQDILTRTFAVSVAGGSNRFLCLHPLTCFHLWHSRLLMSNSPISIARTSRN